ncbi:hypothetical protein [Bradyrhizobium sp. CCBAU 65884]|uniref:hypothetical protein n=1 Tax=Bradyrhizobium sp. CCBAU 65884 TaxID=722477 RepID=UPI002306A3CB|nr:hypothetical protein [Bradyrhizobium sp. CCBAU 65884]
MLPTDVGQYLIFQEQACDDEVQSDDLMDGGRHGLCLSSTLSEERFDEFPDVEQRELPYR